MIIFYHGSDGYRLNQAVKNLADQYKEKYKQGLSASFISAGNNDGLETLENSLKLNSLFNEVNLIVLRDAFTTASASEHAAKILNERETQDRKDAVVLIVGEGEFAKTKHKLLAKLLASKKVKNQEFKPLTGSTLTSWVNDEFKLRGCSADPTAVQELLELTGEDSWDIVQEIEKLSNYSNKIGVREVRELVSDRRNIGPFELVDATATRNVSKALILLEAELTRGRDPYNILGALTGYFRALLSVSNALEQRISQYDIAEQSGLHPFVVRKSALSSRTFKPDETREMFVWLANLDRSSKDGRRILPDELFAFLIRMDSIAN